MLFCFIRRQDEMDESVKQPVERPVGDGDGDIGKEVVGTVIVHLADVLPKGGDGPALEPFGPQTSEREEVVVEVPRPADRQLTHPAVGIPEHRKCLAKVVQTLDRERQLARVEFDGVLVAVDVMVEVREPLSAVGWKSKDSERVTE